MFRSILIVIAALVISASPLTAASAPKVVKVLPHLLDKQGRHSLYPSLFERDIYQANLRAHPEKCSTLRFDVQWRAGALRSDALKLRLELRGPGTDPTKPTVVELPIQAASRWSRWSQVTLPEAEFKKLGQVMAWRVTLLDGSAPVAEQKSFLW